MIAKRNKKILFSTLGILAVGLTVVPLAVGLTSCGGSSKNDNSSTGVQSNPVLDEYDAFNKAKNNILQNKNFGLPSQDQETQLVKVCQDYVSKFQDLVNNSAKLKLNSDQVVWAKTILYSVQQELNNYTTHVEYLGGIPTDNGSAYPCDAFNDYVVWNVSSGLSANPESKSSFDSALYSLQQVPGYLKQLQANFEAGAQAGVAQSIIVLRLFASDLLQNFYSQELNWWADPANASTVQGEITIDNILNGPTGIEVKDYPHTNYVISNESSMKELATEANTKFNQGINIDEFCKQYNEAATAAQKAVDNFVKYFIGTYFKGAIAKDSAYGFGGTTRPLLSRKDDATDPEVERTFEDVSGKHKLYGLGLTQKDLNTKDVGLSFMKDKASGEALYNHLLAISTTSDMNAQQVYDNGIKDTNDGVTNMQALANKVVALETGNDSSITANAVEGTLTKKDTWNPIVEIDSDGEGPANPTATQLNFKYVANESANQKDWESNWQNFNHWLNDEDFFWGREYTNTPTVPSTSNSGSSNVSPSTRTSIATETPASNTMVSKFTDADYKVLLAEDPKSVTDDQLKPYGLTTEDYLYWRTQLTEKGYWKQWNVDDKMVGSYPAKSVLCGAFTEYRDYKKFVDNYAMGYENKHFTKPVDSFTIEPYSYAQRNVAGVGASGGPNDNTFYLNVDPYDDLQKWSETSFTAHETVLGHRTQGEYVAQYGAKVNGKQGPVYSYTSYAEGWAVFVEWLQNQIGAYGTPQAPVNGEPYYGSGLPSSFKGEDAQGFVAGDKHGDSAENIKTFQNGIYWDKANSGVFKLKDDKAGWAVATELGNMLQYYGFLNEAQLRNMRQAVDTAYHANVQDPSGTNLSGGASISDVRKFLHSKSALGVGDVANESIRYLSYPGQATAYMTGKHVMQTIYGNVNKQYMDKHNGEQIISDDKSIQKLFDLYLRNGCIPLDILKDEIDNDSMIKYVIGDAEMMSSDNKYYAPTTEAPKTNTESYVVNDIA